MNPPPIARKWNTWPASCEMIASKLSMNTTAISRPAALSTVFLSSLIWRISPLQKICLSVHSKKIFSSPLRLKPSWKKNSGWHSSGITPSATFGVRNWEASFTKKCFRWYPAPGFWIPNPYPITLSIRIWAFTIGPSSQSSPSPRENL